MRRGPRSATLSVLRIINFRALRRHVLRALLAAFSLGGGVAVVVAVMIETTSVQTAVDDVGYQIAGPAPLRILGATTRAGLDPIAVSRAAQVPGVGAVVPVIRAVTLIRDNDQETFALGLGVDCSARWIVDPKVCEAGQREPPPAISAVFGGTLAPSATLSTDVGQLALGDVQRVADLDTVNLGRVVVLPLSMAKAQFSRGDRVDMLYVTLADEADAADVQARLSQTLGPGFSVHPRSEPARGYNVNSVLLPLLGIFALIAIGIGVILIAQITRLSVEERRHEIAVAAALGASPLAVATGFLAEAALLGAVGSAMGVGTGILIAEPVVASASALTEHFVGVTVPVVLTPAIFVIGPVIGVLLAVLAAAAPSRAASNSPIAAELSGRAGHEQTQPRRLWFKAFAWLAFGLGGVGAARWATAGGGLRSWQAAVADGGAVLAIIGLLLAAAYLSAQMIASVRRRPDRARGATLAIALTGLRADRSRTAAISGAVAVPVVVAILLSGFLLAIHRGAVDVAEAQAQDRIALTTTRFADYGPIDARFSSATKAKVAALPEIDAIERMAEIEINLADGTLAHVQAQDRPTFPFGLLAGQDPQESVAADQLVIGSILARQNNIAIGDVLQLGSGRAAREMVVGTIVATPEYGGRRIYLSYGLAEQIFGPQPAGLIFATPVAGVSSDQVIAAIRATRFAQPVQVLDTDGYAADIATSIGRYLTPLNTLKYGLLAIAFVSVLSTLLLVGLRRRREVALIQALGATRFRVFSITTVEAVVASAAGALLGAVLSVAVIESIRRAAIVNVGLVTPLVFPWSEALIYAGLATLTAVFAAVIPAWRSTRSTPATALRDE